MTAKPAFSFAGTFPLWVRTSDRRRITGLTVRATPLPLMLEAIGQQPYRRIGQIDGWRIYTERDRTWCELLGVIHADEQGPPSRKVPWYLGPDLDGLTVFTGEAETRMTGRLIAATLQRDTVWPGLQTPVAFA